MLYLENRAKETLARHYINPWPNFEMESGRYIKMTPFHTRLDDAGASWGCVSGWERPNWFSESNCKYAIKYKLHKHTIIFVVYM